MQPLLSLLSWYIQSNFYKSTKYSHSNKDVQKIMDENLEEVEANGLTYKFDATELFNK